MRKTPHTHGIRIHPDVQNLQLKFVDLMIHMNNREKQLVNAQQKRDDIVVFAIRVRDQLKKDIEDLDTIIYKCNAFEKSDFKCNK